MFKNKNGGDYGVTYITLIIGLGLLALIISGICFYVLTSLNQGPEAVEFWTPLTGSRVWSI